MLLEFAPERSFRFPEGSHRVRFAGMRTIQRFMNGKMKIQARLTFEDVNTSNSLNVLTLARSFDPSTARGSKLRCFLESWLGSAFLQSKGRQWDLNDLIGQEADVVVHHIHNPGRDEPFCHVAEIYPAGTLPLTLQERRAA